MIQALNFSIYEFDGEVQGEFVWGSGRNHIFEMFYNTSKHTNPGLFLEELDQIIELDPQFIDAHNGFAFWEFENKNYGNAKGFFEQALKIGNNVIPKNFSGQILWGVIDNRPFLRAMHGIGLCHLFTANFEKALRIFNKILGYNPDDNQGIRALAIECNFALGRFNGILGICMQYADDGMPDVLYGKVFAYYRLKQIEKAREALKVAARYSPLVGQELLKKRHKSPINSDPGYITSGGTDEAYDYWERLGRYWTDPDLIAFLKTEIEPQPASRKPTSRKRASQKPASRKLQLVKKT